MERDVRNKAKTVHQMVSELDQKKVSLKIDTWAILPRAASDKNGITESPYQEQNRATPSSS